MAIVTTVYLPFEEMKYKTRMASSIVQQKQKSVCLMLCLNITLTPNLCRVMLHRYQYRCSLCLRCFIDRCTIKVFKFYAKKIALTRGRTDRSAAIAIIYTASCSDPPRRY